jgi:hypothetical protein
MDLWTDISFLRDFAKQNAVPDIDEFVKKVSRDAEDIQDLLEDIFLNRSRFEQYFEPLKPSDTGDRSLPFQKGKISRNILRVYAIKIDDNCFVITGGAIKMSQTMKDHPGTLNELSKLNRAKDFLEENDVFDDCSFFELISE